MSDDNKEKTAEEILAEKKAAEEAAAKEAAEKKDKKVKFTADQMPVVNRLFDEAFQKGAEKAETAAREALEAAKKAAEDEKKALQAQLEDFKKKLETPKEEKPNPEFAALKAQMDEMQSVLGNIRNERDELKKTVHEQKESQKKARKKDAFLSAVSEAKVTFFDPLEAYNLAEGMGYEWDDQHDRPVVLNKETNRPKLNENGEAMSVLDFVKDFAERKKYLVKADVDGGAGSGSERRVEKPKVDEVPDVEKMTPEQFEAYIQGIMNKQR